MLKKGDILIISAILLLSLVSSVLIFTRPRTGTAVTVKVNNEFVYKGSLFENKIIRLDGNTVEIKDGKVSVTQADCKNQICVNHKAITEKGESIICLPNKVIAEIE